MFLTRETINPQRSGAAPRVQVLGRHRTRSLRGQRSHRHRVIISPTRAILAKITTLVS